MLEDSIKRYNNKIINASEVIEELIALGKGIRQRDKNPEETELSDFEYTFCTAIAKNDSAHQGMGENRFFCQAA